MSQGARLPFKHFLLALAVVAIWGSNFVVIRMGLDALPPLLFATLRFSFAVLPAIFFLKKPDLPWRNLMSYGLLIGVGQFGLLFLAMRGNISPGLASLVIQTQVFFTLMLSMRLNKEGVQGYQWLALLLAASGIALIASHTDGSATPLGLVMILAAAFSWACANMVGKQAGRVNMLAYMVWTSVFAVPPLLALSLLVEGPSAMAAGLARADATTWAAVLWQAVGNTLFGYAAWGWLLARHAPATVVPMALLVPVFGMSTAALVLGESLPPWKLIAAALVLSGLALNLLWPLRPWRVRAGH
ncbi:EamA family transporter [Roseateles oligotrophus]|uniref:EamA family transporter n=1 Tax=Roseateles oligotrophus TaxID=1769250 RepID=A0ABT2Y9U2_9BURK|nr:EamA family transporter [Roseateles oligotrophus]MCV2367063.1 EamA family transporter [Roseateles oligotrophus]